MDGRIALLGVVAGVLAAPFLAGGCGNSGTESSSTNDEPRSQPKQSSPTRSHTAHRYEGGEEILESFGAEAAASKRAALLGAFHGYLGAVGRRDYATACTYLLHRVKRSLEQLARKGRLGCAVALPELLAPSAPAISRQQVAGTVTKVRVRGNLAFIVFHAPGARLYQLTLEREGTAWKETTVVASVLAPSPQTLR